MSTLRISISGIIKKEHMILWAKYVAGMQENAYLSDSLDSLYGQ